MNLRQYLIVMSMGTAVAISAWCLVVIGINPVTSGTLAGVIFYFTLGLGLAGLFTISGTSVRAYRYPEAQIGATVTRSLRQGIFLTILVLVCLYLMTQGLLSTLTVIMAVVALGFLEFFFLVSSREGDSRGG